MTLDLDFVRRQFPALGAEAPFREHHLHNAGGSHACQQTIDALHRYYSDTKLQPDPNYPAGARGHAWMQRSHTAWAEALNVPASTIGFGPSTSQNTYVLAQAFRQILGPDDTVVLTNQDHESNTGCIRYAAEAAGARVREWQVDPTTGLLDPADLAPLLDQSVRLLCFPHVSNITGHVNDVGAITAMAKGVDAFTICDGVAYVPHNIPDLTALGVDCYLFSLYKVYSVHQGLMMVQPGLLDALPHQGHFFKAGSRTVADRLAPAGPDHAQVAAAGAVLDYIQATSQHHGGPDGLRAASAFVSDLWHQHEQALTAELLGFLAERNDVRIIGSTTAAGREPVLAFHSHNTPAAAVAKDLCARGWLCSASHFYAHRLMSAVGIDPDAGVVRLSLVHYNSMDEVHGVIGALRDVL